MNEMKVTITLAEFKEMAMKSARYDVLRQTIKDEIRKGNRYPVKDEIVLSLVGLTEYKTDMEKKAAEAVSNG